MTARPTVVPDAIATLRDHYRLAADRATREIVDEGRTPAKAEEIAAIAAQYADREVADWRRRPDAPAGLACRSGCSSCCHVQVSATIPEVILIAGTLLDDREPDDLARLRDRVERHGRVLRGVFGAGRGRLGQPCPLLDDEGGCSIHEVRPLTCRGWNSLDVSRCHAVLADPHAGVEVPTDPVQRTIAQAIALGTQAGLRARGLQHGAVELIAAVRIVLDDPGAVDRWLAGEPAFADAELAAVDPEVHQVEVAFLGRPPVAPEG